MALSKYLRGERGTAAAVVRPLTGQPLATLAVAGIVFYIAWLLGQSAPQFLQFSINGIVIGAIYALMALGFTLVYGTVWFFDLSYGAMATIGAYTVFYFTAREVQTVGRGAVNNDSLNVVMGILIAAVVGWVLFTWLYPRVRDRIGHGVSLSLGGLLALGAGVYVGLMLATPASLNVFLSPAVGLLVAAAAGWSYRALYRRLGRTASLRPLTLLVTLGALALGAYCGLLVARESGTALYLSWAMGAMFGGVTGVALYRGLYYYMRRRARSPLVMLVGSLGILLSITAFISIVFSPDGRPLAQPFGSDPWSFWGATIKPFQVFLIGITLTIFAGLVLILKKTSFGKALRAISDDEEVARVVGINTTVNVAAVFFIGAALAALGGIFLGEDIGGIRPPTGLLLLLKGWVASVVGGIGNVYGALLGGFVLGLVENYGVWYLASQWKDAFAFVLLIVFLAFLPRGLLPRK